MEQCQESWDGWHWLWRRYKAAAWVMVDYDVLVATIEELTIVQRQFLQKVFILEMVNEKLRKLLALWQAVVDILGMYKLEELKEIGRYQGLK